MRSGAGCFIKRGCLQVHTPLTTRAKELMHLYHGLQLPLLSVEERLDVLLHVKWTVKEFDCGLTREIVDLVCLSDLLSFNCIMDNANCADTALSPMLVHRTVVEAFNSLMHVAGRSSAQ